ncbi:unnamed protein product [Rotaria sp. Silwood2]|nr:unnamed protein product [Rotaria sp. Silwood2]CAF4591777.1 unnamed protein product [Rotaria sp. Silwood2]
MTSEKKRSTLLDENGVDSSHSTKNPKRQRLNDIPDIEKDVLNLTSEKAYYIIRSFILFTDGIITTLAFDDKLKSIFDDCPSLNYKHIVYELYYDEEILLKKYYFVVLSLIINQHYSSYFEQNELHRINLLNFLCLIEEENILRNFEKIDNNQLNFSSYFSLIGTFLMIIISHKTITTQDICIFSTILEDDIIDKNISNMPILKDFIILFRDIMHIEFVKKIYLELINDEIGPANSIDDIVFSGIINSTIEEILEKRGISFANLSTCYTAITCFNRTLIINKNIILLRLIDKAKRLSDNTVMFGGLLITVLHEFFHILRRTIIRKAFNPFYERTPPRIISSRNNIHMTEGGFQLDDRLFGTVCETIGHLDGMFLLNYHNWENKNHDDFKKCFNDMKTRDLHTNSIYNRWILPSKGGPMNNNDNDENNTEETLKESSSLDRLNLPGCVLAASWYQFQS